MVEVTGVEGDTISTRELFTFRYHGARRGGGQTDGALESTRMRPDFIPRAARFGLEQELLDAVGISGA